MNVRVLEGTSSQPQELPRPLAFLSSSGRPPSPKLSPPQVALATFEPSLFVEVISFGLPRPGRFPGTAKPKAKKPDPVRWGSPAVCFFRAMGSVLSPSPPFQVFLDFSAVSATAFLGLVCLGAVLLVAVLLVCFPHFSWAAPEESCA